MDLIFKALNDPTRRALLDSLRRKDGQTLQDLERDSSQDGGMTRFGVMKHLAVLEAAGLVVTARRGRFKHHYLNVLPLQEVIDRWIEPLLRKPAARSILNLKSRLEGRDMLDTQTKPDFMMETYIRCTQDALWTALTDPAEVAHYHFMSTGARGRLDSVGDVMEFLMPDGSTMLSTRVIAIEPKTLIDVMFEPAWGADRTGTRVVYRVTPVGDACKLTVEHYEIPEGQGGVRDGWARLLSGLKTHLETGRPVRFDMELMRG